MSSTSRLDRLEKLVQEDLHALPIRSAPQTNSQAQLEGGGVALELPPAGTAVQPGKPATKSDTEKQDTKQPETKLVEENPERKFVWVPEARSAYKPKPESLAKTPMTTTPRETDKAPPAAAALPATGLRKGDLASASDHLTPILAISKFPYKFANKEHSQAIASAFFDQGKFWARGWDLYYVWDDEPTKPLILIREHQATALLTDINKHLKLSLKITDQLREDGFVSRFPDHPRYLPRYLGRIHSREQYDTMIHHAFTQSFRAVGEAPAPPLPASELEQFKRQMEDLWDLTKAKNKAMKAKKHQERLVKNKSMADQFKRAQRYLGLRPTGTPQTTAPKPIDPSLPAPFPFDQSVVFVCVDVESYERAHHKITEIGIATLDTRDIQGIAPGPDGESWRSHIKARHFRIKEHKHLVNHEFVTGNPDGFRFGDSTMIPLRDAASHVAACFRPPFASLELADLYSDPEPRNVILLGHATLCDIKYLQQLGYDPMAQRSILEALDTATLYRVWRREPQTTNLGRILSDFDIVGWGLHNAGNDAVYTVQAMLAVCVREASIRGSVELSEMRGKEKEERMRAAVNEARMRAVEEAEQWGDLEGGGDGGAFVPLE